MDTVEMVKTVMMVIVWLHYCVRQCRTIMMAIFVAMFLASVQHHHHRRHHHQDQHDRQCPHRHYRRHRR